jgi:LacI family transcriptional regulator
MPVIYMGSKSGDENENFVILDNMKAAFMATEHLIGLGHENIDFIGGYENSCSNIDRVRGYRDALRKHGLEKEINVVKSSSFKRSSGYSLALELIKEERVPSAVLAANAIIALGVIEALETHGFTVPGDVSVIGFDDILFASLPKINLTTVAQPKNEMGGVVAKMLLQLIGYNNEDFAQEFLRLLTEWAGICIWKQLAYPL